MAARLAWDNPLTQSAIITSSSEATGWVDDNLANAARWKKWQSALGTTDQWVKFDMGANKTLRVFAAIDAVIHLGGTLKVQANATDVWTTPTVDQVLVVPTVDYTHVWTYWLAAPVSLRWVRFYFTNTGAVNSQVSLGAAFAGTYLEPVRSIASAGLHVGVVDPSVQRYAMGGQRLASTKTMFHEVRGKFPVQKATARNTLRQAYKTIGASIPALLAVDPNDASLIFYGTLGASFGSDHLGSDLWDMPIEFTEDVA